MTPSGIEPATFLFVAQSLSHCAAAVPPPPFPKYHMKILLGILMQKVGGEGGLERSVAIEFVTKGTLYSAKCILLCF